MKLGDLLRGIGFAADVSDIAAERRDAGLCVTCGEEPATAESMLGPECQAEAAKRTGDVAAKLAHGAGQELMRRFFQKPRGD